MIAAHTHMRCMCTYVMSPGIHSFYSPHQQSTTELSHKFSARFYMFLHVSTCFYLLPDGSDFSISSTFASLGESMCFGFVQYDTVEEATVAIEKMNGYARILLFLLV